MRHTFLTIRAFTLIEVMVVIAMVTILLTLVVPAFTSIIQNNYSVNMATSLVSALQFARSEAIRRNTFVSVCAAADSNYNSCGNDWTKGWIIFTDTDGNGDGSISSSDIIVRTEALTGQNAVISLSPSQNNVTYNNVGFPHSTTSNATFTISATGCTGDNERIINISTTGRLVITPAACP